MKELQDLTHVFFAGRFYEVAEIKKFPHGEMIGIYDETPTKHIDYLNPDERINIAYHCNNCQGQGCPTCSGYGLILGKALKLIEK